MNKKIAIITGSVICSVALLFAGALALFTARADSDFSAKAGTVDIDVNNLDLTNATNINPGDNDPANPSEAAPGTEHVFTYDVYNLGNKSVRTRHTIIITVDKAGDSKELMDARYFALFKNKNEITDKTYVLKDGKEVKSLSDSDECVAVKYIFLSDIMDGLGVDIEKGGDAEKESISGVIKQTDKDVVASYSYDLVMLRTAPNSYQACDVNIEVIAEGMQYRNTDDNDWSIAGIVTRKYSTADVSTNVVPARDEDKDGNPISIK